jgi:hypothetical protein
VLSKKGENELLLSNPVSALVVMSRISMKRLERRRKNYTACYLYAVPVDARIHLYAYDTEVFLI